MRLFVAVDFDNKTKQKISELQRELREMSVKGRWKHIDNFHLTLKFLGEVEGQKLDLIRQVLTGAAGAVEPFSIRLGELGCFNGRESLRVVWLGMQGEVQILNRLSTGIDNNLNIIGFEKEKRQFTPHITIAQDVIFKEDFNTVKTIINRFEFEDIYVDRFVLMKSEQIENKRVYTPINELVLNKRP